MPLPILIPIAGFLIGRAIYNALSNEHEPANLVKTLSWIKGYPFETSKGVLFRGICETSSSFPSDTKVCIYIKDGEKFIASSSDSSRDSDGHLCGFGEVFFVAGEPRFEAIVSGAAQNNVRRSTDIRFDVVLVSEGGIVSRSVFSETGDNKFHEPSQSIILDAIAWHIVNVVTLARDLQSGDLTPLIKLVQDFFNLNYEGLDELKALTRNNLDKRMSVVELPSYHNKLFDNDSPLDAKIEGFIASMIAQYIIERPELQTEVHATLLRSIVSQRMDDGLRKSVYDLADELQQHCKTRFTESEQERAKYLNLLGLPVTATRAEIKQAYYEQMKQLHPDVTGNLPSAVRKVVEDKTREINAAYNYLVKNI
jgi:DnaJ-domain-containing protein 1